MSKVQHIAHGMNGKAIAKLSATQLEDAFFMGCENLPQLKDEYKPGVIANMKRIFSAYGEMTRSAKGKRQIRMSVHALVMAEVLAKMS